MGMNCPHQVLDGAFQFHRSDRLGDQFSCLRADDMDTKNLAVFRVGNDFYEAFMLTHNRSAGVGGERKLADFHSVTGLFGLGFTQADAANFGMTVSAIGNL